MHRYIQTRGFMTTGALAIRRTRAHAAAGKATTPETDSAPSQEAGEKSQKKTQAEADLFECLLSIKSSEKNTAIHGASKAAEEPALGSLAKQAASMTLDRSLGTPPSSASPAATPERQHEADELETFLREAMKRQDDLDVQRLWIDGLGLRFTQPPKSIEEIKESMRMAPQILAEAHKRHITRSKPRVAAPMDGAAFEYVMDPRTPKDAWISSPGYKPLKVVPWSMWTHDQAASWESRPVRGLSAPAATTLLANGSLTRKQSRDMARIIRTTLAKAKVPIQTLESSKV
ncbi:hypothetical protein BJ684DRAFT_14392 [Piptocephalis cylindrospora]|uniref:Uncharacterized protein n=1 Tax=Piptocephalis cylindrospora TaxID=1907219 RepID=A0A4P9Y8B7_9FUNG|nr:hypothetical protein BJ684DRAFT_14392 [Piptocephalis cylindrospora]|eukprot:RKP15348.1 hypothetical protein BJ684DRAFT_14392 [Piptocephalis cylindrospora]